MRQALWAKLTDTYLAVCKIKSAMSTGKAPVKHKWVLEWLTGNELF